MGVSAMGEPMVENTADSFAWLFSFACILRGEGKDPYGYCMHPIAR